MNKRWRLLLAGMAGAVGVGAGLWWFVARSPGAAELLARMPRGSGPTLFVDLELLRKLGALKGLNAAGIAREAEYAAFVKGTGFDFERDLDRLMVRFTEGGIWVAATGRFDQSLLSSYAMRQQGKCALGLCSMPGTLPGKDVSWMFPKRGEILLAVSSDQMAVAVMAQQEEGTAPPFQPPASPVWLHLPPSSLRAPPLSIPGAKIFAAALTGTRGVLLTGAAAGAGVRIEMTAEFESEAAAQESSRRLSDATALFRALLRREGKEPNPADFSGIFAGGSFSASGDRVTGGWPVAKEFLSTLAP